MKPLAHRRLARRAAAGVTAAALLAFAAGCGNAPERDQGASNGEGNQAAGATSVDDFGGMEGLVEAAQAEGQLNVIALPPDWTNYGEMIETFQEKYGITVNSAQPDASSQDEINAANQLRGTDRAPDVFDLGPTVARANTDLFAPYKVQTWDDIDDELKDADGRYVSDYGGYMSIGYDASKVPAPTSVQDLLEPEYRGAVALNGDPTQAGAAFTGVVMAALGNGGSPDDVEPGVEFFRRLKEAGNFLPVDPTPATIASGQTPVVIDWDYTNAAQTDANEGTNVDWQVFVPGDAVVGSYYVQAINKDAPNPAAARLWQEFLYSDEGQNIWLKGYGRPVRADAMAEAGTIDQEAFGKLPEASADDAVFLTEEQEETAKEYLSANWAQAVA
ncbi:MAG TPA: extracellular solute-binding protein [Mycobacteriales bacterium]|nr:extracellular solute-binding protein [Mycobacteriales bacterium]